MAFSNEKKKKNHKKTETNFIIAVMSAMMSVKEQCTTCDRDASECLKLIKSDDPSEPGYPNVCKTWKTKCKFSDEKGFPYCCPWCEIDPCACEANRKIERGFLQLFIVPNYYEPKDFEMMKSWSSDKIYAFKRFMLQHTLKNDIIIREYVEEVAYEFDNEYVEEDAVEEEK